MLVLLGSDKISQFSLTCLLGLFEQTSMTLSDGEQQAQSSAASEKQPAGVTASRDGGSEHWPLRAAWASAGSRRRGLRGAAASRVEQPGC